MFDEINDYDNETIETNFCVEVLPQLEVRIARAPNGDERITPPIVFNAMRDCDAPGWLRPLMGETVSKTQILIFEDTRKIPRPIVVMPHITKPNGPDVVIPLTTVNFMFAALNVDVNVLGPGRVEAPGFLPLFGNFPVGIMPSVPSIGAVMPNGIRPKPMLSLDLVGINGFININ